MQVFKKCSNKKEYDNYPHQTKIADILDKMNELDRFSTIVSVPTGGGKTKIAADFCIKMLKSEGNKILWLSDSIDLLTQSIERFQDMNMFRDVAYQLICSTAVYNDLSREKTKKSKYRINEETDNLDSDADIIFASVDTIINADKERLETWFKDVQKQGKVYIIYDEVHHIGAEKVDKFFDHILCGVGEGASILYRFCLIGLTATVYRYDSPVESFNKWFKNGYDEKYGVITSNTSYGVGSKELVNNRIEVVSISELIAQGLLMKPEIIRVDDFESGLPEDKMEYLAKKISKNFEAGNWNKTIIFVDGKTNAVRLQKKLNEKVPCFVYTSDTATDVGADLEDFKKIGNKSAKVMIAVDMVSEGFDVKDIETIYLYSKVESHILLRQRVGRVLRVTKGKDKATVYWQNYFNHTKQVSGTYNNSLDGDVVEDDAEIQRDIARYKRGMQLPAGIYLEKLPTDIETEKELYRRYEYLRVLELFGLDIALEGVGYYEVDDIKIYARQREKRGYEQFHRVIRSDYFSLLIYKDKYLKFEDYAKALGVLEEELLEDIKVNCFYMSNASIKDTKGKIQKKSFIVSDNDIRVFYEWVVKNELNIPSFYDITVASTDMTENDDESKSSRRSDNSIVVATIRKYMEESNISKCYNMLDGIMLHQEIVRYLGRRNWNKAKEYPDMLTYGNKRDVTFNEMCSARTLMEVGAVAESRESGSLFGVEGELALIGRSVDGKYNIKSVIARSVKDIYNDDLLLYAQALQTVPNHIVIRENDVHEYMESLKSSLLASTNLENVNWDKITREFIMALGLNDNDDIVRAQNELFANNIPRLLQYVIYNKAYVMLAKQVRFVDSENRIHSICLNEDEVRMSYKELLDDFGIVQLDDDLNPVEDVISDYRPYMKAIPYYQGIKPEFLCRMLNEILRLGNKQSYQFIDSFGGSGTISLNIDNNLELQQTYNDLGILNNALFMQLKVDKGVMLKKRIAEFIDLILNHTGDEPAALAFLSPYNSILLNINDKKYDFKNICLRDIEDIYRQDYDADVLKHNNAGKEPKWLLLDDRLSVYECNYAKILEETCGNVKVDELRRIEEYLHAILLVLTRVFDETKEKEECDLEQVDLAFLFFVYHSMSARHFYNDATIDKFAKFIGTYEHAVDNCAEILQKIEVVKGKAEDLLVDRGGVDDCVWYHDIPYSETSVSTYSSDWFDEADFVEKLGACKGDYIIASRFNICEARNGNLDLVASKSIEKTDAIKNKEKNIIKFFGRFVSEEFSKCYQDLVVKKFPIEEMDNLDYVESKYKKKANPWTHIADEKTAKYICFAFSQTEAIKSEVKSKKVEYVKNHANISANSIQRMLRNTQISNIEVEIMLTNMELDFAKMPVEKLAGEDGIWYLPTFKTQSSYKIEPVTIVMEYKKFMIDMVLNILAENEYLASEARINAAAFRELYKLKY